MRCSAAARWPRPALRLSRGRAYWPGRLAGDGARGLATLKTRELCCAGAPGVRAARGKCRPTTSTDVTTMGVACVIPVRGSQNSTCTSSHPVRGRGRARRGPRPPQRTISRSAGLVVGAARTLHARRSLTERAREHRPHLLTRLRGWASRAPASQQVASGAGEARISPLKGAIVPGLATSRPVETPSMAHGLRREGARQEAPAFQPRGGRGPPGGAHAIGEQSRAISAAGRAAKLRVCSPEHGGSFRPAGGHSETGHSSHARSAVSGRLAARAQVDPRACVKIGLRSAQAVTVRHLRAVALRNSRPAVQPRARCATRGALAGRGCGTIIRGWNSRIGRNLNLRLNLR